MIHLATFLSCFPFSITLSLLYSPGRLQYKAVCTLVWHPVYCRAQTHTDTHNNVVQNWWNNCSIDISFIEFYLVTRFQSLCFLSDNVPTQCHRHEERISMFGQSRWRFTLSVLPVQNPGRWCISGLTWLQVTPRRRMGHVKISKIGSVWKSLQLHPCIDEDQLCLRQHFSWPRLSYSQEPLMLNSSLARCHQGNKVDHRLKMMLKPFLGVLSLFSSRKKQLQTLPRERDDFSTYFEKLRCLPNSRILK